MDYPTAEFSQEMGELCLSPEYSDVTFIVENQKIPGHRVILARRSSYFRALLYGGLVESSQNEIELNVPLVAFKTLLVYIYTGLMSLSQIKEENILDTLGLANQYGFEALEEAISSHLKRKLSLENCCAILDAARLYNLETLTTVCMTFMDRNAATVLTHPSFKNLSQDSLCCLLQRNSFFAQEIDVFNAVYAWCQYNGTADTTVGGVIWFIR